MTKPGDFPFESLTTPKMYFEAARLRQYPPAKRTLQLNLLVEDTIQPRYRIEKALERFSFPWMTFGGVAAWTRGALLVYSNGESHMTHMAGLVYFHERPWKDLDDAMEIMRLPVGGMHVYDDFGQVCFGHVAHMDLREGLISVEDAFWFTKNRIYQHYMKDIKTEMDDPTKWMIPEKPPHWVEANITLKGLGAGR